MEKKPAENSVSRFLDEVTDQIAWKPLHPSIRQELEEHIEDLADELKNEGIESEDAFRQAVRQMGDPIIIGTELNAVHQIRRTPVLTSLSLLLLLAGFLLAGFMNWSTEQNSGGYLYYLPGAVLLCLTVWKGYPFFIRHWKSLSFGIGILYLFFLVLNCLSRFGHFFWAWKISYLAGSFFPVLFFPVLFSFLFYRFRKSKKNTILTGLLLAASWGDFFHFLFARVPLERSRYCSFQPCLHHRLYDTETSVFRKELEALELCCSYRSSSCFSGFFSPSVLCELPIV